MSLVTVHCSDIAERPGGWCRCEADVMQCVILNPALQGSPFKSFNKKKRRKRVDYIGLHSQRSDVGSGNGYRLAVRRRGSIASSATLVVKGSGSGPRRDSLSAVSENGSLRLKLSRFTCNLQEWQRLVPFNDERHHSSIWKNRLQVDTRCCLETPPKPTNKCVQFYIRGYNGEPPRVREGGAGECSTGPRR